MKFKKIKLIIFILLFALVLFMLFKSCKKTNALTSEYTQNTYTISERDQGQYNLVMVCDISSVNGTAATSFDFFSIKSSNNILQYYLNISTGNSDVLHIDYYNGSQYLVAENINLTSRLLQFNIVYDATDLFLIVYEVKPNIQTSQGLAPSFDGFSRTMKTRFNLSTYYDLTLDWEQNDIYVMPITNAGNWTFNGLINCSYISATDTVEQINSWCDLQLSNATTINYILNQGYNEGYNQGDYVGYQRGALDGFEDGYQEGKDVGYDEGHRDGEIDGYHEGYDVGYADGQAGETAISPAFNVLTGIFTSLGSLLAIELVPHVPLGLFFLVPLFFACVGLILWIWRRN